MTRRAIFLVTLLAFLVLWGWVTVATAAPSSTTIRLATVATLPSASSHSGKFYMVSDALTATSCTTGGGSYENLCQSDGSTWVLAASSGVVCTRNAASGCVGIDASNNVGIGNTSSQLQKLDVQMTSTHGRTSGDPDAYYVNVASKGRTILTPVSAEDGTFFGVQGSLQMNGSQAYVRGVFVPGTNGSADINLGVRGYVDAASSSTTTSAGAVGCRADAEGGGTITNLMCYGSEKFDITGTGTTVTNAIGLYLFPGGIKIGAGATVTNTYGVFVANLAHSSTGTQTNTPFSFYASDTAAYNYFGGFTGFGVTAPTAPVHIVRTPTDTSGNIRGQFIALTPSPTGASTAEFVGSNVNFTLNNSGAITSTTTTAAIRGYADVSATASANVTSLAGVQARTENESATSVVTSAYGFRVEHLRNVGAGSITSAYGLHLPVSTISTGSIGTLYGVYMSAQSQPTAAYGVYIEALTSATAFPFYYNGATPFAVKGDGTVAIGHAAPLFPLHIVASSTLTSGNARGEFINMTAAPTGSSSATFTGQSITLTANNSAAMTSTSTIAALRAYSDVTSTASAAITSFAAVEGRAENESASVTVTSLYGFRLEHLRNTAGGGVTSAYGVHIPSATKGSGTLTTMYGIFVASQASADTAYGHYTDNFTATLGYPFFYNGTSTNLKWAVLKTGFQGIGTITPAAELQVASIQTSSPRGIMSSQHSTGTDGARLHLRKSRGTNAVPTTIVTGDTLGKIVVEAHDGTGYLEMGGLTFTSEGTIGTNRTPTKACLSTATDAAPSVLTDRFCVDSAGLATFTGSATLTGTLTSSRTSDIGWSIQSAANQACNTTCTSACVHGWDAGAATIVDCSDATADKCVCAGSS